jgi:hypothetical protein
MSTNKKKKIRKNQHPYYPHMEKVGTGGIVVDIYRDDLMGKYVTPLKRII